jgi:hypothetical protein
MRDEFTYDWDTKAIKASEVVRDRNSICAGFSNTFAAIMRANGIPARALKVIYKVVNPVSRQEVTGRKTDFMHANNEFFVEGIGWIPVDATFGINNKNSENAALYFFAHDIGVYIILCEDQDKRYQVDSQDFGTGNSPILDFRTKFQRHASAKLSTTSSGSGFTGDGRLQSKLFCTVAEPRREPEQIVSDGQPDTGTRRGPAWITVWSDVEGWHVRTHTSNDETHQYEIKAIPVDGRIGSWKHLNEKQWRSSRKKISTGYRSNTPNGIDFTVTPGTRLINFSFRIDNLIDQRTIFIGTQAVSPRKYDFALTAITPETAKAQPRVIDKPKPVGEKCQNVAVDGQHLSLDMPDATGKPGIGVPCGIEAWATLWSDPDGWHIRTYADGDDDHNFQITATVANGKVMQWKHHNERLFRNNDKEKLALGFGTDSFKGIDLKLSSETTSISLYIIIDNNPKSPNIFIGSKSEQPSTFPLVFQVRPAESIHNEGQK